MIDPTKLERIKVSLAVLFFFTIVYPIKYVILPLLKITYENIHFIFVFFMWWVLMVITGSPEGFNAELKKKLMSDPSKIKWIVEPIITIANINITPIDLLLGFMAIMLVYKAYVILSEYWHVWKATLGHITMISMWAVFTLMGDKKNSTMCLRSEGEKKSLITFYGITLLIILIIIGAYILHGHISDIFVDVISNGTYMHNDTITLTSNETMIPMNLSTDTMEKFV